MLIGGTLVATGAPFALGVYFHFTGFAHADPWVGLLYMIVYIAGQHPHRAARLAVLSE